MITRRGAALVGVAALFLAGGAWWRPAFGLAGIWLVLAGGLLVADWALTPGPDAWQVRRRHEPRLSLAVWNPIQVEVRLLRGLRGVSIWLRDTPPPAFRVAEEERVLAARARPGQSLTLGYRVYPPRRGDYAFGDLYLRWESVLGLLRRQARFPGAETVKVYPNLADVRKYDLLLRRHREREMGLRPVRRRGAGAEFERLREYQPDDEYRRIHWKATARRRRPVTMEFQAERSQTVVALLDVGRLMRSPVGDVAKMDYAINAVLLLAYVALGKGDRVGLLTFADQVLHWMPPREGRLQFRRMLDVLYAVQGQPVEPDYVQPMAYLAAHQRRRALVLVFTDLTVSLSSRNLVRQMVLLRRRHLPLLVSLRDPTVEALARQPVTEPAQLYQRMVAERLLEERALTLQRLRSQGVLTLDVAADQLSVAVIDEYLALKERMML